MEKIEDKNSGTEEKDSKKPSVTEVMKIHGLSSQSKFSSGVPIYLDDGTTGDCSLQESV